MIALDPTQNAKLPRDMLLESCLQATADLPSALETYLE